jgi:5-methylcytosine-specific restriction endonuclease McrA
MIRSPRKNQWVRASKKCQGRCWYCGAKPEELTIDHAKPRSRGGKNTDENLVPACGYCNNLKANLTLSEFRKYAKMRIIRNLMILGFCSGDMGKIRITFFGEGNSRPFAW